LAKNVNVSGFPDETGKTANPAQAGWWKNYAGKTPDLLLFRAKAPSSFIR
jgi:hypothetical protein